MNPLQDIAKELKSCVKKVSSEDVTHNFYLDKILMKIL